MKNGETKNQAKQVAFCGMAAAVSVVLMMLSAIIPVFGYVGPMAASLALLWVLENFGKKAAILTWVAAAALILILGPDKESAFFYVFFGWYPIAKPALDGIRSGFFRRLVKFLLFLLLSVAMDLVLIKVLGITYEEDIPSELQSSLNALGVDVPTILFFMEAVFCLIMAGTMALYDVLLGRLSKTKFFRRKRV